MDTVRPIDPHSLHALLGVSAAPLVADVRRPDDYAADPVLVAGAVRAEGGALPPGVAPGRAVIVYCVKGAQVGRSAAASLAAAGHDVRYLEGGLRAWRAAGLPTIRARPEWRVPGGSRWITRARPKIDRIACPWLILRFIDPLARFDYVPAGEVLAQAAAREAVPYDIPGAQVGHRGERCSFDAQLEDFALHDAALARLATIVRGADTGRLDLAPQSAALLAASLGLSQRYADDHEMLAAAMPLYDGLHAWCRAQEGRREPREWIPA